MALLGIRGASYPGCAARSASLVTRVPIRVPGSVRHISRTRTSPGTIPSSSHVLVVAVNLCTDNASPCSKYIEECRGCKCTILCADCHEDTRPTRDCPMAILFNGQRSHCQAGRAADIACPRVRRRVSFVRCGFCNRCISDHVHVVIRQCCLRRVGMQGLLGGT